LIFDLSAQSNPLWTLTEESQITFSRDAERNIDADAYQLAQLNMAELRYTLSKAPAEFSAGAPVEMLLPMPDGHFERFRVYDSPVMRSQLAAKYPEIRSFAAQSIEHPQIKARIGYGHKGFHAAIRSPKGIAFIDPYIRDQQTYYASYYLKDIATNLKSFICGVEGERVLENPLEGIDFNEEITAHRDAAFRGNRGQPASLRIYDFALSCTGEFGAMHEGVISEVLSVMETATNRLNLILENELAVRLLLINDNEKVLSVDGASDFFNRPTNGGGLLGQNQALLDSVIRTQNYDIGHIFTVRCTDVGGIASLGGVCGATKGQGVTCHRTTNVSAITAVITAHEVGHQFNANHTWSNCGGPGSGATAVEPGSGTTIMSYAGLCNDQNIASPSDDYYHVASLEEMYRFTRTSNGNTCPEIVAINNHYPELNWNYDDGFYIPIRTPFELTATADDEDGDQLSYCWEQFNTGPLSEIGSPTGNAPIFRSFPPVATPTRVFPRMSEILRNNTFNLNDEVLPTYTRDMNFRCTVRDNNPEGGVATWKEVAFYATELAGPFEVTLPNTNVEWEGGIYTEVKWNVNNTDQAPVNCQTVNIRLSLDGGNTYPIMLAENVPNDGTHFTTIPDIQTDLARLRIEAANNIFFDISNQNFRIIPATTARYTLEITPSIQQVCLPNSAVLDITTASVFGFNEPIELQVNGLPPGAVADLSSSSLLPSENGTLSINMDAVTVEGDFEIELVAITANLDTAYRYVTLTLVSNDFSSLTLMEPGNGSNGIEELPVFNWNASEDAQSYWFELATSPAFGNTIIASGNDLDTTYFAITNLLEKNTPYYWRVRPFNECGYGPWTSTSAFHTFSSSCASFASNNVPIFISRIGMPVVESTLTVPQDAIITDLNIPIIRGQHDLIKHLDVSLISPAGTEVLLFSDICGNTQSLRVGFDDEAFTDIPCPPIGNSVHRAQNPLSAFIGENTQGTWRLKMAVNDDAGEGGGLEEWNLQFCSSVSLSSPYLVNNEQLVVAPGTNRKIKTIELLSQDDDNSPDELTYTIVDETKHGSIRLNNRILNAGDTFLQSDIDNGDLWYTHDGNDATSDGFTFGVSDGEGGWFGTPLFDILIDSETSSVDFEDNNRLNIYPVPTRNQLNIAFDKNPEKALLLSIINVQGQLLSSIELDQPALLQTIDVSQLATGLYFLKVESKEYSLIRKFTIQK